MSDVPRFSSFRAGEVLGRFTLSVDRLAPAHDPQNPVTSLNFIDHDKQDGFVLVLAPADADAMLRFLNRPETIRL